MIVTRSSNGPLVSERRTPVAPRPPEPAKPLAPKVEVRMVEPERPPISRPVTEPGQISVAQQSAGQAYGMVSRFT